MSETKRAFKYGDLQFMLTAAQDGFLRGQLDFVRMQPHSPTRLITNAPDAMKCIWVARRTQWGPKDGQRCHFTRTVSAADAGRDGGMVKSTLVLPK